MFLMAFPLPSNSQLTRITDDLGAARYALLLGSISVAVKGENCFGRKRNPKPILSPVVDTIPPK